MKKNMLKLVCLIMAMVLAMSLTACGGSEDKTVTVDGLTITLPGNFESQADVAAQNGQNFVYATPFQVVMGLKEEKALFAEYGMELTLSEYTDLIISIHELDASVEYIGSIPTVTFTSNVNGTTYKYIAAMYESADAFWMIQCSSEIDRFDRSYEDFVTYLTSVKF